MLPRYFFNLLANSSSILTVQLIVLYSTQIGLAKSQLFTLGNRSRVFPVECPFYEFYPRLDSIDKITCPSAFHVCCSDIAISFTNACCLSSNPKLELLMVFGICLQLMLFCFCFMYLLKNYLFGPLTRRFNRLFRSDAQIAIDESLAICNRNDRPPSFDELLEINANFFGTDSDTYDILPKYEELKELSYIHNAHD